jgi:hypothetical protein
MPSYTDPEYMRKYRIAHRAEINARQRIYNTANREKINARSKARRAARTPEQKESDRLKDREKYLRHYVSAMLTGARTRSRDRGWPVPTITKADLRIPEICPVLGIRLEVGRGKSGAHSPSLDVVDRNRFYVPGNVQVISQKANQIKNEATIEDMRRVLAYMEASQNGCKARETALAAQ